jgi:hypothetical protein
MDHAFGCVKKAPAEFIVEEYSPRSAPFDRTQGRLRTRRVRIFILLNFVLFVTFVVQQIKGSYQAIHTEA